MDTESKFTILNGCYDNAQHLRKYLCIYVIAQGFTKMPSHLGKCQIYDITANIYRSYSDARPVTVIVYHSDVMWPYYIWRQHSVHDVPSRQRLDWLRQVVPRKLHDPLKYLILSLCYTLLSIFVPVEELKDTRPLKICVTTNGGHFERPPFC
jgi:hypothetical protein